jgi:SAM-dependent methyltransferase
MESTNPEFGTGATIVKRYICHVQPECGELFVGGNRVTELSTREYWDAVHAQEQETWLSMQQPAAPAAHTPVLHSLKKRLRAFAEKLLSADTLAYIFGHEEHLLWDMIYRHHMPKQPGAKLLEVGSAPGDHLVQLNRAFGIDPYGVEYSAGGAQLNRDVFKASGIPPEQVIEADFFAPEFQARYRESFDVVLSRGFIEHFEDVDNVLHKHLNLLKPGGRLFVMIPNLRGFNYFLTWLLHKDLIAIHNLKIMEKRVFAGLFADKNLTPRFCDYYAVFSFFLFNTKPDSCMRHVLRLGFYLQFPLNVGFRLLFGATRGRSRWFSPALMFVGEKRGMR